MGNDSSCCKEKMKHISTHLETFEFLNIDRLEKKEKPRFDNSKKSSQEIKYDRTTKITDAENVEHMNVICDAAQKKRFEDEFNYDSFPRRPSFSTYPFGGPCKYPDGSTYEGQFKNGLRHGRGVLIWPDGSIYEGYWVDNYSCGKGRKILQNGDHYIGDWKDGRSDGFGAYHHFHSNIIYNGSWVCGKPTGLALETYSDGSQYEGEFLDGDKHGYGLFTWPEGSSYDGTFSNNKLQGKGIHQYKYRNLYLEG